MLEYVCRVKLVGPAPGTSCHAVPARMAVSGEGLVGKGTFRTSIVQHTYVYSLVCEVENASHSNVWTSDLPNIVLVHVDLQTSQRPSRCICGDANASSYVSPASFTAFSLVPKMNPNSIANITFMSGRPRP